MPATLTLHHPPVILGFSPGPDALLRQIQPQFAKEARRICDRIPFFKPVDETYEVLSAKGEVLKLDDPSVRLRASRMAIGECWELMNLSEFLFKWNKRKDAKPAFKIKTTQFDIEFHDHDSCNEFLFDLEGKWEEWGKEEHPEHGARRRSASRHTA